MYGHEFRELFAGRDREEVAEVLGVSVQQVIDWESGIYGDAAERAQLLLSGQPVPEPEAESKPDWETPSNVHAYVHQTGRPVEEFFGPVEKLTEHWPVLGLAFDVVLAGGRVDFFYAVGQTVGEPSDGGYSLQVTGGGALAVTDADGHLVVVYGPTHWLQYGPHRPDSLIHGI